MNIRSTTASLILVSLFSLAGCGSAGPVDPESSSSESVQQEQVIKVIWKCTTTCVTAANGANPPTVYYSSSTTSSNAGMDAWGACHDAYGSTAVPINTTCTAVPGSIKEPAKDTTTEE